MSENTVETSIPSPDSCPISHLLGKRMSEMTDEELTEATIKLRTARETPAVMRALLAGKPKKAKAKKEVKKPNLADLL